MLTTNALIYFFKHPVDWQGGGITLGGKIPEEKKKKVTMQSYASPQRRIGIGRNLRSLLVDVPLRNTRYFVRKVIQPRYESKKEFFS